VVPHLTVAFLAAPKVFAPAAPVKPTLTLSFPYRAVCRLVYTPRPSFAHILGMSLDATVDFEAVERYDADLEVPGTGTDGG
jgi:hypothetical protein